MKNRTKAILLSALLAGAALSAAALACDFGSYWENYKKMFVEWNEYKVFDEPKCCSSGARGNSYEMAMGIPGHDWKAVADMEDFSLPISEQEQFLQAENLGPYVRKTGGKNHE